VRLAETRGGAAQVVLLEGVSGVGNTAPPREFAARTDHRWLGASGEQLEAGLPYGVIEQLVAALDEPLPEHLAALGSHELGAL
jgi:hypothetical protein